MPNGWTDPFFVRLRQLMTGTTGTITLRFPKGWITEITAAEVLNETAIRGHCHAYAYDQAEEGGIAVFTGDFQDVGNGIAGVFMWEGKISSRDAIAVNLYDVVAADSIYFVVQCRSRRP